MQPSKKSNTSLNKIYTYWEGEMPAYIQMCRESLAKGGLEVIWLDETNTPAMDLDIHHKTDYLKAKLVSENGGFWIDADMLVTQPLTPLLDYFDTHDFIGIPGFFGAKAGSPMITRWYQAIEKILAEKKELGFSDLILPLLEDPEFREFEPLTREMICPIYHTGDEFWKLFQDGDPDEYITENNYIVTLYNSQFSQDFKSRTREDILAQDWLISKMFKNVLCE